jgi:hypothetical protein
VKSDSEGYTERFLHLMTKQSWCLGRVIGALAIGCVIALLPRLTSNLRESGVVGTIKLAVEGMQLPGAAIGLIVYRNVHAIHLWVVEATNVIFYSGLVYFLLAMWAKQKIKS